MASEGGQNKAPDVAAAPGSHAVITAAAAAAAASAYPGSHEWQAMFPYVWPGQHVMPAYGTPMPYPPFHPGAYYPHPSMAVSMAYAMGDSEGKHAEGKDKKNGSSGNTPEKSRDGGKGTSGSGNMASQNSSDGSSETKDDDAEAEGSSAKKRKYGKSITEGESSQALSLYNNSNDLPQFARVRTASKLPVSAPGRTTVTPPPPATNLHIGMDIWNTSHTSALALNSRPNDAPQFHMDERELKRERRKQSNRESARRSRLRKQQECEELGKKVKELSGENSELKAKVLELKEACQHVETENKQLMEEMVRKHGPEVVTTLCLNPCSLAVGKSPNVNGGNANSN